MNTTIITVVGKDRCGIVSRVSTYLSSKDINILDISQTIVGGLFTMLMKVDVPENGIDHSSLCEDMDALGSEIGVSIRCQREEIFDMMHRV